MSPVPPPEASNAVAPKKHHRLQTRVGLSIGGLLLLLAMVLAGVLSAAAEKQILRISAENLENLSLQMGRELSDDMDRFSRDVLEQSTRERFTEPGASRASMRMGLDQFKQGHPEFAYVSIVDAATARVIAANGGIFEDGSAAGRPTYEEGKKAPYLGDVHDAVRLAELLPKPANGEALRFLDVAAPIYDASGKAFRVFAAHVAWQWANGVRDHVLGPLKVKRGVEVFIVDTKGKVVLGSGATPVGTSLAMLSSDRMPSAQRVVWPGGNTYLSFVADVLPQGRFSGFGWKVVVRQPYDLAFGPARNLRYAFFLGALAFGLAAAGIARVVAGRLTLPVRLLADAAKRAGSQEGFSALQSAGGVGEVLEVNRALSKLSDTARVHAEASETKDRQFAVLAASLPQVVWQADAAGRMEYVNKE